MADQFSAFRKKQQQSFSSPNNSVSSSSSQQQSKASTPSSSAKGFPQADYQDWWELPERFRSVPRISQVVFQLIDPPADRRRPDLEEEEMVYVESAGARCSLASA